MGHAASKVMEIQEEGFTWRLYPIYSKLMLASGDVQDWGGKGPWEKENQESVIETPINANVDTNGQPETKTKHQDTHAQKERN